MQALGPELTLTLVSISSQVSWITTRWQDAATFYQAVSNLPSSRQSLPFG